MLANGIFKDGGISVNGVFTPSETMKYLNSNDGLINKGMKGAEAIKTNENT